MSLPECPVDSARKRDIQLSRRAGNMAVMNDTQTLINLVETLHIGTPATAGNLALIPLVARNMADPPNYLFYQQAHDMGLISIEEVSEAGAVGELLVHNRAGRPVLLVEGEVLLGMKQTRVLNLTILVPAQAGLTVPVSCVESGRWRATSDEATGKADVHLSPGVRAAKTVTVGRSMRSGRSFASDQGAVWAGVDSVLDGHAAHAPSRSYADLAVQAASRLGAAARTIEPEPDQVGVIACAGGRVACADVFESPQVLAALWEGLVASYEAEAMIAGVTRARPEEARRWFRSIAVGSASVGPELGEGAHVTVVAPGAEAAALVDHGRVLHLSAFPAHRIPTPSRFAPPGARS